MNTDAVDTTISVVLVEDDEGLARLTARYLESHGVAVTIAGDGRDGIAKVRGRHSVAPPIYASDGLIDVPAASTREVPARYRAD